MYHCPSDEPCHALRVGACLLTWALYAAFISPQAFFGESFPLAMQKLFAGDLTESRGLWVVLVVLGVGCAWAGVQAARSHDDPINGRSLLWSICVIALGVYAMRSGWYTKGYLETSRALWLGWMASNAANLWLQLRGVFARESDAPDGRFDVPDDVPCRLLPWLRRRTIKITEWTAGNVPQPVPWQAPPGIEHGGPVQLVYVQDREGNFIPVQVPAVPVNRRLR